MPQMMRKRSSFGKRIIFKGINRHEWNAEGGRVVTEEDISNLNNLYGYFEDSVIVSMNYISGIRFVEIIILFSGPCGMSSIRLMKNIKN